MGEAPVYSARLGAISDAQFAAATQRLGVGDFVRAEPVSTGLFGQNVFLTTTKGAFVLRGAPHWVKGPNDAAYRPEDRWQFRKEAYFVARLHEETQTPAPWPYLVDEASDIFGWPYAIMPRMPGTCFDDHSIREALGPEDQRRVAAALGATLAEMQRLTSLFAGDFDTETIALAPYAGGDLAHRIGKMRAMLDSAAHALVPDDLEWVNAAIDAAEPAGRDRPNTYVHHDYKLNNLTVMRDGAGWRVSGLFDFHEASFGDGAVDLVRQACGYLDADPALTRAFIGAYRAASTVAPAPAALMRAYVIYDRLVFWDFFTQPAQRASWTHGRTFRAWAEPHVAGVCALC